MLVEKKHKTLIIEHIRRYLPQATIHAFGSRVDGNAQPYSDLDLAVNNGKPIALNILFELKEALAETSIPYLIDLIDYHRLDDHFKQIIDEKSVLW